MIKFLLKKAKSVVSCSYFFFPVEKKETKETFLSSKAHPKKEKGVALLIAISTLALMMGFVTDLILSTSVSLEMSSSIKDKIKSEYAAKSGLNLGLYLFGVTWGIELLKPQLTGEKGKLVDSDESFWGFINSLPVLGADTVKLQEEFSDILSEDVLGLRGVMNEDNRRIMGLFEDSFKIRIEDENRRININDCSRGRCTNVIENLTALFSCPAEKAFLSDKDLTPEELAYRIKDYISESTNTSSESGVGDKNAYYQKQMPPYKAKGLPFDSLDELKMVHGWDDEIHAVFAPYLTIYPINNTNNKQSSKVNINTASTDLLGCLVPSSLSESCRESFIKKMAKIKKEGQSVAGEDVSGTLKDLMCYAPGIDEESAPDPSSWFSVNSSAFKLTVEGRTNNKKTVLNVVLKRLNPGEKIDGRDKQKNKRSYQVLYWHFS